MHGDLVVFGPFEAHLGDRVLRREGVDVHLTPMSWQLLGLLIRERGRTVTKHDVMTALWPDEPATWMFPCGLLPPPAITTTAIPNAVRGLAYWASFDSVDGGDPKTWSFSGLPAGVVARGSEISLGPQGSVLQKRLLAACKNR